MALLALISTIFVHLTLTDAERRFKLDPVEITTLPNKLRVVTEATPGHFSSLGVYIDAGSRFEIPRMSGASHVLDRMAFKVGIISQSSYTKPFFNPVGSSLPRIGMR